MAGGGDLNDFVLAASHVNDDGTIHHSSSSHCIVSFSLLGTPFSGKIDDIRKFRDRFMLNNPAGIAAADLYYRLSHAIVPHLAESSLLSIRWSLALQALLACALLFIFARFFRHRIQLQSANVAGS